MYISAKFIKVNVYLQTDKRRSVFVNKTKLFRCSKELVANIIFFLIVNVLLLQEVNRQKDFLMNLVNL